MSRPRSFASIIRVLLSIVFLMAGVTKFTSAGWATRFADWGYPPWLSPIVGMAEVAAAGLLPIRQTRRPAAFALAGVMAAAAATHLVHGETPRVIVSLVLGGLLVWTTRSPQPQPRNLERP